ncbi:MAG TPA: TIGR00153 family protein [Caldithrix abyssi]|uniref:TIGR00153 family protein n=1 Tax=Caldithrix abyssi TaxID=187145 RepID=A0A7V5RPY4_CALAY|nr:TIGR00153 family protein [Caldithrix abyssi]
MSILESLFAKSPFGLLQTHMDKVTRCADKLNDLFDAHRQNDFEKVSQIAEEISKLEHSADMTKNDIRNNLPRGLLLAINRMDLLTILSMQDGIADKAEDIAVLLTLKNVKPIKSIEKEFEAFLAKNLEAVHASHQLILGLQELIKYSFTGSEAQKVIKESYNISVLEHEADLLQHSILKKLYNMEKEIDYTCFHLWMNVMQNMASMSNIAERLAHRVAMLIENA